MQLKPTEHQIQKAILDYLKARKILAWRQNAGGFVIKEGNKTRYIKTGIAGLPDIAVMLPYGIMLFLEVKNEKGKLSEKQKEFFEKARELGHYCEVVRSIDDVEKILSNLTKLKK